MKKILLSASLCLFIISANAQYSFEHYNSGSDTIKVIENGKTLKNPFAGGFDVPQFSNIDLNMDGKKDLFVFDREGYRVTTFINKGGTNEIKYEFAPEYIKAFPTLSDWCLLVDYNGDGKEDIFASIPGGLKVYKNVSTSTELKFELAFKELNSDYGNFITRLAVQNNDLPAIIDVDEDGDIDILSFASSIDSSGESIYWFKNMSKERYNSLDSMDFVIGKYCWGKFRESYTNCHINLQYPIGICGSSGKSIPTITKEEFDKKMLAKASDGKHSGSTTTIYDANGDGKYDMLIGDVSCNNMYLLTNGADNISPIMTQAYYQYPPSHPINIEIFPAAFIVDINNDGLKDIVSSINMTNGAKNTNHVESYLNNGSNTINRYDFNSDNFLLEDMIEVAEGAAPCFVDYNLDGLIDIVISNAGYYQGNGVYKTGLALYKNIGTTTLAKYELVTRDWFGFSSLNIANMAPAFGDMDNDGDVDMVCGSNDGTLNYFVNNASANTTMSLSFVPNFFAGIDVGNFSSPFIYDFESDGKPEIIVGERNANVNLFSNTGSLSNPVYTLTTDSLYKINLNNYVLYPTGRGRLTIQKLRQNEAPRVIVSNANSRVYILGEVNTNFTTANNTRVDSIDLLAGSFSNSSGGFYISFADLNNDHKPELLAGAPQGGIFMYRNTSSTVGISDNKIESSFNIYPNPTNDNLFIKSEMNDIFNSVKIFDLKGTLVYENNIESTFLKVNTDSFNSGIYFVQIQGENTICTKKIIIN